MYFVLDPDTSYCAARMSIVRSPFLSRSVQLFAMLCSGPESARRKVIAGEVSQS